MRLQPVNPPGGRRRLTVLGFAAAAIAAGIAFGAPASASPEGDILDAGTASVVPDSYVVVLRPTAATTAGNLAGQYGGTVGHVYTKALRGFSVRMNEANAKRLAAHPAVAYVQRDGIYTIAAPAASWGLDRIDQRDLPLDGQYAYPSAAATVKAYIVDTGILTTHTDFGGRAVHGRDTVNNDNDATDCNGHGTHVAGTVGGNNYGVARGVQLVAVRVLNCQGSGTTAGVAAGVDWVTADHAAGQPAVANMSLGGGVDTALDNAVAASIADGVSYGIAAGNSNANACNASPARVPSAITVGATTQTDARASFSNFGTCVDIFAPGQGITSAWYTSPTATNTISGTSMAAPHVTGAAALIIAANPAFTPQQVRDAMVGNATPGKVTSPGTGSPNQLLFVGQGGGEPPPPPPPPPPGCSGTNGTDVAIPDPGTASSTIAIGGCNRNASGTSTVEVHIRHTYRGDLRIDLVAPDGTAYRLKNSSFFDSADNVDATYTVNLGSEVANGTWTLRVQDTFDADTGVIDTWTITV